MVSKNRKLSINIRFETIHKGTVPLSTETLRRELQLHSLNGEKSRGFNQEEFPFLKPELKDLHLASCLDHVDFNWNKVIVLFFR